MNFCDSKTCHNLARAFAGECMEGARYQFLAKDALAQGYVALQLMLKTIAKEEMSHARVFWDLLTSHGGGVINNVMLEDAGYPFKTGDIADQLKFASEYEKSENTSIYPAFAKIAEDEGYKDISEKFKQIAKVEYSHYLKVKQLYDGFKTGTVYKKDKVSEWKCGLCGHEENAKEAFKTCVLCGAKQGTCNIPIKTGEN